MVLLQGSWCIGSSAASVLDAEGLEWLLSMFPLSNPWIVDDSEMGKEDRAVVTARAFHLRWIGQRCGEVLGEDYPVPVIREGHGSIWRIRKPDELLTAFS